MNTPDSIDDYLRTLSADKRAALNRLRAIIKATAPRAQECISYRIPAIRLDGKVLVCFGATANHCAFYPGSGATVAAHRGDLKGYATSKGTIRFAADKPLPVALLRKLVKARISEDVLKAAARDTSKAKVGPTDRSRMPSDPEVDGFMRARTRAR